MATDAAGAARRACERLRCPICAEPKLVYVCPYCDGTGARHGSASIPCPYCDATGVAWLCPAYVAPDGRPYGWYVAGDAVAVTAGRAMIARAREGAHGG